MSRRALLLLPLLAAGVFAAAADSRWASVDTHALAAPASVEASLDSLAAYLGQGIATDEEKARAIYRWVTDSIAYDTASFFSGRIPDQAAGSVLASRRSVCAGYSTLFADLGRRMGLAVEVIHGYAKGYGYGPGALFTGTNHDWNAVRIDGEWRLVDSTWGAGYVGDDRRFVKEFTECFFLSPPEQFILSHLPADPQWQLLSAPWSMEKFTSAVFVYPSAFTLGVSARSHFEAVFSADGRARVLFDAPAEVVAMASIDGNDDLTLTQIVDGGFEVLCSFAAPGRYTLRVYATTAAKAAESYPQVIEYTIDAKSGLGAAANFPFTYNNYGTRRIRLEAPMSQRLAAGASVDFAMSVPGATSVMVVSGNKQTMLARNGDSFTGSVKVAPGFLNVYAQFPDKGSYEGILGYQGK
jgi:hypothetical protein